MSSSPGELGDGPPHPQYSLGSALTWHLGGAQTRTKTLEG